MEKRFIKVLALTLLLIVFIVTVYCKNGNNNIKQKQKTIIVTDIDGNTYSTVTIGTQVWMAENLRTTRFRNGYFIPYFNDRWAFDNQKTGAFSNYNNDENLSRVYGCLYNWYAINDKSNIAPVGWHVPTINEWYTLALFLDRNSKTDVSKGGIISTIAGAMLKDAGTKFWSNRNGEATNSSGFSALPGGTFGKYGYIELGESAYFWSSTEEFKDVACQISLFYNDNTMAQINHGESMGASVRCVKD